MLGLPAPFVPHSASLSPATATRVLSTPVPVSAPPTSLDECLFSISLVSVPLAVRFCQFWLCEEAQCVYLRRHLGSLKPTFNSPCPGQKVRELKQAREEGSLSRLESELGKAEVTAGCFSLLCSSAVASPSNLPAHTLRHCGFQLPEPKPVLQRGGSYRKALQNEVVPGF